VNIVGGAVGGDGGEMRGRLSDAAAQPRRRRGVGGRQEAGVQVGVDDIEVELVRRNVGHVVRRLQSSVDPEEPLGRRRCTPARACNRLTH